MMARHLGDTGRYISKLEGHLSYTERQFKKHKDESHRRIMALENEKRTLLRTHADNIEAFERTLSRFKEELQNLKRVNMETSDELADLKDELQDKNEALSKCDEELLAFKETSLDYAKDIANLREEIQALNQIISGHEMELVKLKSEHAQEIDEKKQEISTKDELISDLLVKLDTLQHIITMHRMSTWARFKRRVARSFRRGSSDDHKPDGGNIGGNIAAISADKTVVARNTK
ncbi:uncharacterized protein LOC5518842 [Nematostella vectensis]|uniref:uncharacterized protein LOC5518842 n=1 Tax=Nematostella vectensis TaxID=45351 RepID=UPI00138FC969|nr:uncharacterized protein LOC5518842 [Nematostella vectensis]